MWLTSQGAGFPRGTMRGAARRRPPLWVILTMQALLACLPAASLPDFARDAPGREGREDGRDKHGGGIGVALCAMERDAGLVEALLEAVHHSVGG